MYSEMPTFNKIVCAGLAGIFACGSINMPAQALTKAETMSLSYGQVKGSGLANRCPSVVGEETIALSSGKQYKITDLCLEPKSWQVSYLSEVSVRIIIRNASMRMILIKHSY